MLCANHLTEVLSLCAVFFTLWQSVQKINADIWKQVHFPPSFFYQPANDWNCFFFVTNEWHRLKYWCWHIHRILMYIDDFTKNTLISLHCYPSNIHIRCKIYTSKHFLKIHSSFTEILWDNLLCIGYTDWIQSKLWKTLKNYSHSFNPTNLFSILEIS